MRTSDTNVSISDAVMCFSSSLRLLWSRAVMVSSANTSYPICFCMNGNCFAMYSCKNKMQWITAETNPSHNHTETAHLGLGSTCLFSHKLNWEKDFHLQFRVLSVCECILFLRGLGSHHDDCTQILPDLWRFSNSSSLTAVFFHCVHTPVVDLIFHTLLPSPGFSCSSAGRV